VIVNGFTQGRKQLGVAGSHASQTLEMASVNEAISLLCKRGLHMDAHFPFVKGALDLYE
jgi:hypothetical protein